MNIDPENPVVALCAAGMAVEGDREHARTLFERAWSICRDDYDATIAAHFLARHQASAAETLDWNERALRHAGLVPDGRAAEFLASLYLNVGDSYLAVDRLEDAAAAAEHARVNLDAVTEGGYRDFVDRGIQRLSDRIAAVRREAAPVDSYRESHS